MDKHESVFLLMRAKDGRKRPSRKTVPVCKGELIQEFPQPLPADQHSREHNFHVLNDPNITLWCDPTDVAPLVDSECHYLLAVSPGHRIKEFNNRDKKEYVMKLITGNEVSFRTNESRLVKGRIRYLGPVQGKIGVYLGVEIDQDDQYRGKGTTSGHPFFDCGRKNGVWVSMDMVVYPPLTTTTATATGQHAPRINRATSKPSDTGQQTPRKHKPAHKPSPETDQYVHITHNDAEPQQGSKEGNTAKNIVSRAWKYLTSYAVEAMEQQHSEIFKEGDCVVAYSLKDQRPIIATVRWTGMVKLSQESQVPKAMFAGLETDAEIDPDREFPGMHIILGGPTWGDFLARSGRTKLYLPESLLIKAADHIKELHGKQCQSKKIAENLNMTESQVVDGGFSGVDVREQEKILAEANAQHNAQKQNRREFYQVEEGLAAGTGKQETDFNIGDVTSSMVDEQKAELDRLEKEREIGAARKLYNEAARGRIPHTATPVSHGPANGAGLQHNGSTLPKAPYPAGTVQAEAQQYPRSPGHAERVQGGYQQRPNSHQSDLSAGHHNQRRPSNDQQYQNQINARPPGLQRQGSRPDHELQQYPPHDTYQDHPALAMAPPNYDVAQGGPIARQSHHHHPPPHPAAMQNTEDEHHHRHSPKVHSRRTAAENQQLADQIPDWLKIDNVVGVKIPGSHEPVTGMVKFVGVVQVKGVNQLTAGVQLDDPMVGCTDGTYEGKRLFFCTAGTGYLCPISDLMELQSMYPDTPPTTPATGRASPTHATRAPPVVANPLSKYACYENDDQLGRPELFSQYIGEPRGIQGHHNSCYLDSTVFGLFALSDAFDVMFLDAASQSLMQGSGQEEEYCMKTKDILWKGIVNPLRKNGVARFESVMELRNYLEHLGTMEGANRDEKDPEEFLNMLFKKVLHVRPFISIKRPFGVEEEYFVQLFFEINPEKNIIPFTEVLLWNMFKEQNILFAEIPSKLLLQMPRFGKDFKMYNRIFPSLSLDVAPILDPTSSCHSQHSLQAQNPPECFLCNTSAAVVACEECVQVYRVVSKVFLCDECSKLTHKTRQHNTLPVHKLEFPMDLLSVICIETSHYVCFTRCEDRWLFHDSMADRMADMYNIPRVTEVTQELNEWVYSGNVERLMSSKSWEIPECVRRFTQDAYMCVYVNSDMDMYK